MDKKITNIRGQVAIWVVIALFLVASIILFFFIESRISTPNKVVIDEVNPKLFIDGCVRKHVNDAVDIMLPQGGFLEPGHSKLYKDIHVSYLCYNRGNYNPCINQHPMFLNDIGGEIKEYILPKVDACYLELKRELEKRKSEVSLGEMNMAVNLGPGRVFVDLDREVTISKLEESIRFNNFEVEVQNPIYELGRIAMEIASQESKYCYFQSVGYMILYPKFKITKLPMSDSTNIYTIIDKNSLKEMNIAIRGCAIPPGL